MPEHYFCEECRPEEHPETIAALEKGEKIWEEREKAKRNEKKRGKGRKSTGGNKGRASEVKSDRPSETVSSSPAPASTPAQETGNKRKRGDIKEESVPAQQDSVAASVESVAPMKTGEESVKPARADKRRKSSVPDTKATSRLDTETALVDIDDLPKDRQNVAKALSKIVADDVRGRSKAGYRIPDGHTADSLGNHYAVRVEYALFMNHGGGAGPSNPPYAAQFRALNPNLKKNKLLIERLLNGSLTADELATMSSADMASEELQREKAALKAEADKQAMMVNEDGPRMRRTHKGDELIENDQQAGSESVYTAQPVRHRESMADTEMSGMGATSPPQVDGPGGFRGSPENTNGQPLTVDTSRQSVGGLDRRTSSQNFDMNAVWAKTQQSPTAQHAQAARPMQQPPRRRSSVQPSAQDATQEDPDVDRMLQDDDDDDGYSPADYDGDGSVVWRGRLTQLEVAELVVNARFVAGRDITSTISWKQLLPDQLIIDGRIPIEKTEQYLQGLQWSSSSDVSVLAFTAYEDAAAFNKIFTYFSDRKRYAVVDKTKPAMIKDLYIIPVGAGAELPVHVDMLEYCTVKKPIEEPMLLVTCVVHRQPPPDITTTQQTEVPQPTQPQNATNGHLPQHMRPGAPGPAASPLNTQYSPATQQHGFDQLAAPPTGYGSGSPLPPNPYAAPPMYPVAQPGFPPAHQGTHPNPLVAQILGELANAPTVTMLLEHEPHMGKQKLDSLRDLLEKHPECMYDMGALGTLLKPV